MSQRTSSLLPLSAATLLALAGCAVPRQTRFALPFVPPAPAAAEAVAINADPPPLPANLYLNSEAPTYVSAQSRTPRTPTASDLLIAKADDAYRKGRRFYQSGEKDKARAQFDLAIDLFFEAAANPADRQSFERKFEETVDNIHRYDLAGLGSGAAVETPRFEKPPLDDLLEMTFPVDPKLKIKVKEQMQATSSQLPLSMNDSVLGFINFFSGRGRKTLIAGLERSGRYRPLIQRILDEEGVPQELIYLAQAESGFMPRALSNKQAAGMWQFVKFRGQEYGLMQTPYSDDRLDPEKATRSAARHLHDLYAHFGDWYLAIAAYNCGPGCVDKAVERTGFADFWELRSLNVLPVETTNYVPIILAMTIMAKNPQAYDLEGAVPQQALEYDVATMTSPTQMALVADLTETPLSQLQELNPALLKNVAPAGYQLNVPRGTGASLLASLESVPPERRASWRMHKVESGETLAMIGRQYGASPSVIAAANRMDSQSPMAGDRLVIPQQAAAPSVARKPVAARRPTAGASRPASSHVASSHVASRGAASRTASSHNTSSHAAAAPKAAGKKSVARQPASKRGTFTKAAAGKQASTVGRS